ncbi:hypothetical protein [Egbenema bharatensis]|uniref:hypothetical protein n=1 Tax=Egbenema bharatensis TaxID=3463334 RepID=UPI003A84BF7B
MSFRRTPPPDVASPEILNGSPGNRALKYGNDRRPGSQNFARPVGAMGPAQWALDIGDQLTGRASIPREDHIIPDWMEPIGGSGFYISPNEAVDPTDCSRFANSPYCGGSGFDPIAASNASPIGITPTFATNPDLSEFCVSTGMSLFGVSTPQLDVCYRAPWARPRQPDPPVPDLPDDPGRESVWVPADSRNFAPGCVYFYTVSFVHVRREDGSIEWIERNPMRVSGRPIGLRAFRFPGSTTWEAATYRQTPQGLSLANYLLWGATIQGNYTPEQRAAIAASIPPPRISSIWISEEEADQRACIIEDPRPIPPPPPTGDDDMSCCAENEELLRLIARRLGTDSYPVQTPKWLMVDDESEETHESLTELTAWFVKQMDGLFGQFPIDITIEDIDPLTEGNQEQQVKLPNLAETLAELYGLTVKNSVNSDIAINFLTRLASEVISTKNAAIVTQDYARANASFLGYRGNPKAREIDYAFDPEGVESLDKILRESKKKVIGWQNDDKESVVDFLQKIMFSAGIIKAVFMRRRDQAEDLISEIADLTDPNSPERQQQQERWREFINELNNPESGFNRDSFTFPVVTDYSLSQEENFPTNPNNTTQGNG